MGFDRREHPNLKFDRVVAYNLKDGEEIDRAAADEDNFEMRRLQARKALLDTCATEEERTQIMALMDEWDKEENLPADLLADKKTDG